MFCPSCGKENANTFGYCQACGRPLTPIPGMSAASGQAAAPAQSPVVPQPVQMQRKRNPALIAIIAIAVAIIIGGGAFLAANINRETPEQRIGRLMREAAGLQPVHNSFFPGTASSTTRFASSIEICFASIANTWKQSKTQIPVLSRNWARLNPSLTLHLLPRD